MAAKPDMPRQTALNLLDQVLGQKRPYDEALAAIALAGRDRGFLRQITALTLRRLGQLDDLIDHCLEKPLNPKLISVRNALRLGAAQFLFMDTPPSAAINTAVELIRTHKAGPVRRLTGLVNAVLRRLAKEGEEWRATQDAARLNTPGWLWHSWCDAFGEDVARAIAASHLAEPPLDITLKDAGAADHWLHVLNAELLPTGSLRLRNAGDVTRLPGFKEGAWWVQDVAASLPVKLLGDVAGKNVIDLCAAPGGKTAQLAAAGADVTAVDINERRLALVRDNLQRLNLTAGIVCADATSWRPDTLADIVLLDAPCSATGTLRRHPDIAWTKTQADVDSLAAVQAAMLTAAADMVSPGGTLLFSTCSLQPEEGEQQISAFLAAHGAFRLDPLTPNGLPGLDMCISKTGLLRSLPCHLMATSKGGGGMDGFFAARLVKQG